MSGPIRLPVVVCHWGSMWGLRDAFGLEWFCEANAEQAMNQIAVALNATLSAPAEAGEPSKGGDDTADPRLRERTKEGTPVASPASATAPAPAGEALSQLIASQRDLDPDEKRALWANREELYITDEHWESVRDRRRVEAEQAEGAAHANAEIAQLRSRVEALETALRPLLSEHACDDDRARARAALVKL